MTNATLSWPVQLIGNASRIHFKISSVIVLYTTDAHIMMQYNLANHISDIYIRTQYKKLIQIFKCSYDNSTVNTKSKPHVLEHICTNSQAKQKQHSYDIIGILIGTRNSCTGRSPVWSIGHACSCRRHVAAYWKEQTWRSQNCKYLPWLWTDLKMDFTNGFSIFFLVVLEAEKIVFRKFFF